MSNYFDQFRAATRCGGDAYSQAQARRAQRELGWRDDRSAMAERQADRAEYDRTCR